MRSERVTFSEARNSDLYFTDYTIPKPSSMPSKISANATAFCIPESVTFLTSLAPKNEPINADIVPAKITIPFSFEVISEKCFEKNVVP